VILRRPVSNALELAAANAHDRHPGFIMKLRITSQSARLGVRLLMSELRQGGHSLPELRVVPKAEVWVALSRVVAVRKAVAAYQLKRFARGPDREDREAHVSSARCWLQVG
jgi:hypothetical protein